MSNRALLNLLRGGMGDFHVGASGASSAASAGPVRFGGERRDHTDHVATHYTFSSSMHTNDKHDYSQQKNREMTSKKKRSEMSKDDGGSTTGDNSSSDEEEGPKKKKKGLYRRGEDADGDGKTGEGKGPKGKGFWADKNNNKKPDGFEKK